jgi:hypothetical protein
VKLSDDELTNALQSVLATWRIPAYVELQVRPRRHLLHPMLECYSHERDLADTSNETRPLWQLLVSTETWLRTFWRDATPAEVKDIRVALTEMLAFLVQNDRIDPGRECRNKLEWILRTVSTKEA